MSTIGSDASIDDSIAAQLAPEDPTQIGSFRILGVLGTGGMGRVYLGIAETGYVAVKQVLPSLAATSGFVRRFQREVEILYRVPAGVGPRVLAHDSTAPRPWFATEYVPGLAVDEAIQLSGPLPADALWSLLAEAAAHLRVVHEAGIVHRDLKPANILFTRDGVTLIDFGIARAANQARLTRDGASFGTHGFTAPEQEAGDREVTAAADVYSLGALLLHAATGRSPGRVPDAGPVRAVDPDLADLIESCLAHDPTARPTAAGLLDSVRDRGLPVEAPWPPAIIDRLIQREDFAATPITKIPTVPPPPPDEPEPLPPVRTQRRRGLLLALPIVLLVAAGTVATVALVPSLFAAHTSDQSQSSSPPANDETASPSAQPSGAASRVPSPTPTGPGGATGTAAPATTKPPNRGSQNPTAGPRPTTAPAAATYYLLENSATGQCLSGTYAFGPVTADACANRVAANGWKYYYANGDTFELINKANGYCIADSGGFAAMTTCAGSTDQLWRIGYASQDGGTLQNVKSGLCLEPNTSYSAPVTSCTNPQPKHLWSKAGTV